jgi:hypothetical protein
VPFARVAGVCAFLVGASGFLYSVFFFVHVATDETWPRTVSWILLLVGGILTTVVFTALYARLRDVEPGFALVALLLGVIGAVGAAVHGAFEVAKAIEPPEGGDFPNPIDPRGFLTFGVAGIALLLVAWLARRGDVLPRRLVALAYIAGALLVVVYLGRLIVVDVDDPLLLVPAILLGFVVNPVLYVWLGLVLFRPPVRG